jgi:hypothetical protein
MCYCALLFRGTSCKIFVMFIYYLGRCCFFVYSGSFHSLPLVAAFKSGFHDLVGGVSLSPVTISLWAVVFAFGHV